VPVFLGTLYIGYYTCMASQISKLHMKRDHDHFLVEYSHKYLVFTLISFLRLKFSQHTPATSSQHRI